MRRLALKLVTLAAVGWILFVNRSEFLASIPALERLASKIEAKLEIRRIASVVRKYHADTGRYPKDDLSGAIRKYLVIRRQKDPAKDQWGTEYRLIPGTLAFYIVSAGPDTIWDTGDDLRSRHSLPHP